ncbi:MAG: ribosome biogenesis GTPase YlqF [Eubacteriales bacterium]|nr:ribosome biogenesis GTPase YlqF [Eubacteriales bacterium]
MNIQWYPGHMTKARRKIEADIKLVDLVIELLDARCPIATENPDIRRITAKKQRLILLNKADLADETVTKKWIEHFKEQGITAIALDSRGRDSIDRIRKAAAALTEAKREKERARGITGERALKAMICGIPNVGKSTFINSMLGKASTKTGNKPGVTKGTQWININDSLLLLDTPGVLWPRFDDEETAVSLAEIGSINDQVINVEELSIKFIDFMLVNYRSNLFERYGISEEEFKEKVDNMEVHVLGVSIEALAALELISVKRGCLKKGAEPDFARSSKLIVDEFRAGRLGRISLQRPKV